MTMPIGSKSCCRLALVLQATARHAHYIQAHSASPNRLQLPLTGDPEAWKPEGCCPAHRAAAAVAHDSISSSGSSAAAAADPAQALPQPLQQVTRLVLHTVLNFLVELTWDSLNAFEGPSQNQWFRSAAERSARGLPPAPAQLCKCAVSICSLLIVGVSRCNLVLSNQL
jgi:hypothetical protein